MKLCLASNNKHKINELKALLPGFELLSLEEIGCRVDIPENENTIAGNSLAKAKYVWDNFGIACIADDSGLEVDALGGRPGVYSARYAGPERSDALNMAKVLAELSETENRTARFVSIITLFDAQVIEQFYGAIEGVIIKEPRGSGGFGYDPVFVPNGYSETFAELSAEIKNEISHRAEAVKKLVAYLERSNTR
jgi:XTP/dITP diphosphohydrolase